MTDERTRLSRLLALAGSEADHLRAVRWRLLSDDCQVSEARLAELLNSDIGIDRLESFGAKFSRMQDTVIDKLVPTLLRAAGESTGTAIDNLARLERFELIGSSDAWLAMRGLRNRLVHEYIDQPDILAPSLAQACRFTETMHEDFIAMRNYARQRLIDD